MTHRQAEAVHHVEDPPDADPEAIVTPAEVAGVRRRAERGRCMAEALAETEVLDIQGDVEREFLVAWPSESRSLMNRRVVIAAVLFEAHPTFPSG